MRRIGSYAFSECRALEEIEFPEGLTEIGDYAFRGCQALSEIRLPQGLETIGDGAFLGCSELRHVRLPDTLSSLGDAAFAECGSLESIRLPGSLRVIGSSCFRDCHLLYEAEIPEGVTELQEAIFIRCPRLERLSLPASIRRLSPMALNDCSGLRTVEFRGAVPGMAAFAEEVCVHAAEGLIPAKTLLGALPAFISRRDEFTDAEVRQYADSVRAAAWELREVMLADEAVFNFAEEHQLMDRPVVEWMLQQAAEGQRTELAARLLEYRSRQQDASGADPWDL